MSESTIQTTPEELPALLEERNYALFEGRVPCTPVVCFEVDETGRPVPLGETTLFTIPTSEDTFDLTLPSIASLARGDVDPGRFGTTPPDEYTGFFLAIERIASRFCARAERPVTDQEFHRLYRHLLRRPDGTDRHPLFGYLQAAVRMHMLLHDTSQKEFEAVVSRLVRSTKTFSMGPASRNYWQEWLVRLV